MEPMDRQAMHELVVRAIDAQRESRAFAAMMAVDQIAKGRFGLGGGWYLALFCRWNEDRLGAIDDRIRGGEMLATVAVDLEAVLATLDPALPAPLAFAEWFRSIERSRAAQECADVIDAKRLFTQPGELPTADHVLAVRAMSQAERKARFAAEETRWRAMIMGDPPDAPNKDRGWRVDSLADGSLHHALSPLGGAVWSFRCLQDAHRYVIERNEGRDHDAALAAVTGRP